MDSDMTVTMNRGITNAYARHLKARGLRPATITAYLGWLRRLSAWADDAPLTTLTGEDLEAWIASNTWKPNSHRKAVQAIQAFYRWLTTDGRIDDDPSVGLRPAKAARPVPNPCPEDVYVRALDAATGDTYWRIRLGGDTGLRRAELAAVHSSDVRDLAGGPALRVTGKGGVVRWVPLPEDLAAWLRLQRGYVFASAAGHMTPTAVGRWYSQRLGVNPHQLRHRYATLAYRSGHDINAVKTLLGHASVATTQVYVAVADDDLVASARGAWGDAVPGLRLVQGA